MFYESYNSFMTQIELQSLEAAITRMDQADLSEVDADEYQRMLGRIVELRELLEKKGGA